MKLHTLFLAGALMLVCGSASAAQLGIELAPSSANPASPQMGDHLRFHSVIRNDGTAPVDGLIAWISVVRVDKGNEQPIDLEDWSAHKAVTVQSLAPGKTLATDWPMRLIQAGNYRVAISAASRSGTGLTASKFADFTVRQKPVVESGRVIPIAVGIPLLLGAMMLLRVRRP